ncbi:aromatic-L-amino-acid decarboxylase-like [Eriocheir sinensis]|uniref:aromatic-L-amino-acid decarboxylase-like n=1 Tax=Eriocheir sinensis TaxID=95602 RepID=UPI0021CA1DF5|nr:aromatic-L-amino-acid decarboxylase-like [Eriocheir sinensis]XP_050689747.1 aromatic-L-amino-acid decarboxylase-like [Eriocheir sinensis]
MEGEEFRAASQEMTDFIVKYLDNIRERRVLPEVTPGYLRPLLPPAAPDAPETWRDVMNDIERVIMPGVTHWHSPQFHAYFPTGNSYPSILADMLSDAIGCIGFTWIASPACTELEVVMMDWLGQLLGLPEQFLAASGGQGGGVIQGTASEATLVALLSAKAKKLSDLTSSGTTTTTTSSNTTSDDQRRVTDQLKKEHSCKLVAYCSDQAHSSVERACMLGGVEVRKVDSDEDFAMRGPALRKRVLEDLKNKMVPFLVVSTMGATPACSFDNLREIGEVAKEFDLWNHVDAAYAGSALICEEFRGLSDGIELANSFNFNPHKWFLINFDCSAMWFKDAREVVDAFNVDPLYLKHEHQGAVPDYRHWQIPLGRRFRSLKLWFVMRLYGKEGLQAHIRKQVSLAHRFEDRVKSDQRFEIILPVTLGLVCFRLKGQSNEVNEELYKKINNGGVIHLVPSKIRDVYFLRLAVCSRQTEEKDIDLAWREVLKQTEALLQ